MCEYSDEESGTKCPYDSLPDSEYCIFHLRDDNKNIYEFNIRLNELLKKDGEIINFNGFYFPPGTANFSNKNFYKKVIFNYATFSGEANFQHAIFSGDADFWHAKFCKNANFFEAKFFGDANFFYTNFSGETTFQWAEFSMEASFYNTEYSGDAQYDHVKFLGYTSYLGAEFSGKVNFCNAEFSGDEVSFLYARFSGEVYFSEAKFSHFAGFSDVEFLDDAKFFIVTFSGFADFSGTDFLGDAIFDDCKFYNEACFLQTSFSGLASFKSAIFAGKTDFIPDDSRAINFKNAFFLDNVRIKANLSRCLFEGSNIERADLTYSTWDKKNINPNDDDLPIISVIYISNIFSSIVRFFFKSSIIIWEESQERLSANWIKLEEIYRRLKQSYQRYGDYSTAGEFYFQEMECKRKQFGFFRRQFWNIFYRGFCGYGEKPFNAISVSILIIIGFAVIYFYSGILILGKGTINYNLNFDSFDLLSIKEFLWCLYMSTNAFTTMGYGDVQPIGWSRFFATIESGIGIFMTALFIFVFTRKMLR